MSNTDVRWLRRVASAGALLGLVACADRALVPTEGPTFDLSRGDQHDDHDEHEGRGRGKAGAAAIDVWAERGSDGTTAIVVTSYAAEDTYFLTPAGCISKVGLKVYAANSRRDHHEGDEAWRREFNGLHTGSTWTYTTRGLDVGMRVAVEARVGCLPRGRGDDVDVEATVASRTDPATDLETFLVTTALHDDTIRSVDSTLYSRRLMTGARALVDTSYTFTSVAGNEQTGWFDGIVDAEVPFPLVEFVATQATGSAGYHVIYNTTNATNVAGAPGSGSSTCANLSSGPEAARVELFICSYPSDALFRNGHTTITYRRTATNVASVVRQYYVAYTNGVPSACTPTAADPFMTAPCFTNTTSPGAALQPYGTSYTFDVVLRTPSRRYSARVVVPLTKAPLSIVEPGTCTDTPLEANGPSVPAMLLHACEGSRLTTVRTSGVMAPLIGLTETVP